MFDHSALLCSQDSPAALISSPRKSLEIADQPYCPYAGTAPSQRISTLNRFRELPCAASWSSTSGALGLPPSRTPAERCSVNGDVFVHIVPSVWVSPTPQQRSVAGQYRHLGTSAPATTLVHYCRPSPRGHFSRESVHFFEDWTDIGISRDHPNKNGQILTKTHARERENADVRRK